MCEETKCEHKHEPIPCLSLLRLPCPTEAVSIQAQDSGVAESTNVLVDVMMLGRSRTFIVVQNIVFLNTAPSYWGPVTGGFGNQLLTERADGRGGHYGRGGFGQRGYRGGRGHLLDHKSIINYYYYEKECNGVCESS